VEAADKLSGAGLQMAFYVLKSAFRTKLHLVAIDRFRDPIGEQYQDIAMFQWNRRANAK
jgi:hypothetical protein